MEQDVLKKANILNERIKKLKLLKEYTEDGDEYWWHDILHLLLPEHIYEKLGYEKIYNVGGLSYEKEFATDIVELVDKLIIKYSNELEKL